MPNRTVRKPTHGGRATPAVGFRKIPAETTGTGVGNVSCSAALAKAAGRKDACLAKQSPGAHSVKDLAALEATLLERQNLQRELGAGPKTEIVVQIGPAVSEARVTPFLAASRGAGFVKVVRL